MTAEDDVRAASEEFYASLNRMLAGDSAYEVGVEIAEFAIAGQPLTVNSRVTNIFHRENGAWKVVHHHGDKAAGIMESLERLRS